MARALGALTCLDAGSAHARELPALFAQGPRFRRVLAKAGGLFVLAPLEIAAFRGLLPPCSAALRPRSAIPAIPAIPPRLFAGFCAKRPCFRSLSFYRRSDRFPPSSLIRGFFSSFRKPALMQTENDLFLHRKRQENRLSGRSNPRGSWRSSARRWA